MKAALYTVYRPKMANGFKIKDHHLLLILIDVAWLSFLFLLILCLVPVMGANTADYDIRCLLNNIHYPLPWLHVGLSTASSSRFSTKFPVISQKVAKKNYQKLLKKKNKNVFKSDIMPKYANCTTKFLSIFVQFCSVTSVANTTLPSIKTKKYNEPVKLLNDLLHPRHSSQSSMNLRPLFWIFSKNRWPSSPATFILRPWAWSAPGGGFGSFFTANS